MFNDPEVSATKAIEFMEEHDFVEPTPAGVARLFREKAGTARKGGLDRREIGEYLAKLKPYNNEVRQAYVETLCGARPAPKSLARELTPTLLPPAQRLHGQDVRGGAARVLQPSDGCSAAGAGTDDEQPHGPLQHGYAAAAGGHAHRV